MWYRPLQLSRSIVSNLGATLGGVAPAATVASYRRCASPAIALLMSEALTVPPCSTGENRAQ